MDDLLLKIRLEALKNSLTKIQSIFEWVEERRGELNKLNDNIEQAGQHLNAVSYHINSLRNAAAPPFGPPKVDPSLASLLDVVHSETRELIGVVNAAKNNIDRIRMHRPAIEKNFADAVKDDLEEITRDWFKTINDNLQALSAGAKGNADAVLDKAWQDYTGIISENLRLFFSDYVQFLGGLALRDAGLDAGICRIADDLIRSCGAIGKTNWNAMTIPASQEAVTLARSIRVGFPEWTIWALPLAAHELGQVAITGNTVWEKYIAEESKKHKRAKDKVNRHMRVCLADAFATCAMGPAYACSAILLRLNPLSAYGDTANHPADAKRAYVILTMLQKMRDQDPIVVPPYSDIIDSLEKGWNTALARAKPAGALSEDERKQLGSWTEEMFAALSKKPARGLYDGKLWNSTRAALEKLLKGEDPTEDLKGTEEWRDVLNAAWSCRADDVDDSAAIDVKAHELWKLIERKQQQKQASKTEAFARPGGEALPSTKGESKPSWPKAAT